MSANKLPPVLPAVFAKLKLGFLGKIKKETGSFDYMSSDPMRPVRAPIIFVLPRLAAL